MPNAIQGALQIKVGGGPSRILDRTSEVANGALDGHRLRVGIHLSTLTREPRTEQRYANSSRKYSMEQSGALHKPPLARNFQSDSNLHHIYPPQAIPRVPEALAYSSTLNDESHNVTSVLCRSSSSVGLVAIPRNVTTTCQFSPQYWQNRVSIGVWWSGPNDSASITSNAKPPITSRRSPGK